MKKMVKLLAAIAAIAMMATLAVTGASAAVSSDGRTLTSADGKVYLSLEQDGDVWYLYAGLTAGYSEAVAYAYDADQTTISYTGISRIRNWSFNDEMVHVAAGAESPDTIVLTGAAENGVPEGEYLAVARVDGVGTLTVKGVFALIIGDNEEEFIEMDGTINNNPVVTPPPSTPEPGTPEPGTPEPGTPEPGTPGEPIVTTPSVPSGPKVPDGGVALAIIPTLIAAGAVIVAAKRKSR